MAAPRVGERVPSELADARVLDHAESARRLGDFWRDGACLVSFLRHFGCTGCSQHVTELSPRLFELAWLGVRAVFVGNGEPRYIDGFVERHALADKRVDIVTDPTLRAFRAAGLLRSAWATFGPRSIAQKVRAMAAGHPFGGVQGDSLQQGGSLVVDSRGVVALYHRSESLGGHASPADILDVALRLAASRVEVHV